MISENLMKKIISEQKKEMELAHKLARELTRLGIELTPRQRRECINFVSVRSNYLELQSSGLDKRSIEVDLRFRIGTLTRASDQLAKDGKPFELSGDEFINRQIFLALLESAYLDQEKRTKKNIRDALALDMHLWVIHQILVQNKISKPAYELTFILTKIGYWRVFGESLKAGTIENRISKARRFIQEAIKHGACAPDLISDTPHWNSEAFISTLCNGQRDREKIWRKVLGVTKLRDTPWDQAVSDLGGKLPRFKVQIKMMDAALKDEGEYGMPLPKLLDYLPRKYQKIMNQLF